MSSTPSSRIRLIAVDLDGTLLRKDRSIPPANAEALRRAQSDGVVVCLASGRVITSIRPYAEEIGLDAPIVSCNGAYVVDAEGAVVTDRKLPDAARDHVLRYAIDRKLHVNSYVGGDVHFSADDAWGDTYRSRVRHFTPIISGYDGIAEQRPTKMLFMDDPESIQRHYATLSSELDPETTAIALSEPEYIEFLPPGLNKGIGLRALCERLGIAREEVAAVGDWLNDLEMVKWSGFGGAVGNAHPDVVSAADIVLPDHESDAVAAFVQAAVYDGVQR